MKQKEESMMT